MWSAMTLELSVPALGPSQPKAKIHGDPHVRKGQHPAGIKAEQLSLPGPAPLLRPPAGTCSECTCQASVRLLISALQLAPLPLALPCHMPSRRIAVLPSCFGQSAARTDACSKTSRNSRDRLAGRDASHTQASDKSASAALDSAPASLACSPATSAGTRVYSWCSCRLTGSRQASRSACGTPAFSSASHSKAMTCDAHAAGHHKLLAPRGHAWMHQHCFTAKASIFLAVYSVQSRLPHTHLCRQCHVLLMAAPQVHHCSAPALDRVMDNCRCS